MPAEFWADCERQVSLGASWGRDAKLNAPWCRDVGGIDDEVGWMVARGRRCPMLELRLELQRASSCLPAWSSSQASKAVSVVRRLTDARQSQNIPARLFPRTTHIRFRSATLLSAEQSPETGSSHLSSPQSCLPPPNSPFWAPPPAPSASSSWCITSRRLRKRYAQRMLTTDHYKLMRL